MTKHDRLMNALAEIKDICSKNEDEELGCGKRCPFLMGNNGDNFRDCEVMLVMHDKYKEPIEIPEEWRVGRNG